MSVAGTIIPKDYRKPHEYAIEKLALHDLLRKIEFTNQFCNDASTMTIDMSKRASGQFRYEYIAQKIRDNLLNFKAFQINDSHCYISSIQALMLLYMINCKDIKLYIYDKNLKFPQHYQVRWLIKKKASRQPIGLNIDILGEMISIMGVYGHTTSGTFKNP